MAEGKNWKAIARQICTDEGVDEKVTAAVMEAIDSISSEPTIPSTSLIIRRLKVVGDLELDRRFAEGINLIVGPNFAGKSTVLDLIKYSFVGKMKLIDEEIRGKIDEILMEIQLNERTLTIRRTLKRRQNGIYEGAMNDVLADRAVAVVNSVADFMPFFMGELQYPHLSKLASKQGDVEKATRAVGFGDFYRAFYQDQSRGYSELFSRESFETRQHVFNVLIGATNSRLSNRARIRYGELENRLHIDQHGLRSFQQFVATKADRMAGESDGKKALQELRARLRNAEAKLAARKQGIPSLVESSVEVSSADIERVQAELTLLSQRREETLATIADQQSRVRELGLERKAVEKQKAAGRVLQSYYPVICPRCTQGIPRDWAEREDSHGECRICHRDAPIDDDLAAAANASIAEIDEAITEVQRDQLEATAQLEQIAEQWERLKQDRTDKVRESATPISQAVSNIYETLRTLEVHVARSRSSIGELENDHGHLEAERKRLQRIRAEIQVWKALEQRAVDDEKAESYGNPYATFARHVAEFLDNLKKAHRGQVTLDPRGLLNIGGTAFDDFRPGEKARACIAVFYSLLRMSIENEGRLPRFLVIDSPRQQEMDLADYETIARLYRELAELADKKGRRMQIIVATASAGMDHITTDAKKWQLSGEEKTLKAQDALVKA